MKIRQRFWALVAAGALLGFLWVGLSAVADDQDKTRDADRAAIRKTVQNLTAAFERGDAAQAAAQMTAGAELIPDDAPPLRGREAIQKAYAAHFAEQPKTKLTLDGKSLRFLAQDTAIEEGLMRIAAGNEAPTAQRYSLLHVRESGQWRIAVIREWPAEKPDLEDLAWLIGSWETKRADAEVRTTYTWLGDKAFLRGEITMSLQGKTISGMQLIGVDPRTGVLKTWLFESDGGFAAGTCTRYGNVWHFVTSGTTAEGGELSATNVLVRVDNETITWQPINIVHDDTHVSNLPPVKVTRSKARGQ